MSTSSAALRHGDLPGPEAALLEAVEQELAALLEAVEQELADALHDGPVLVVARREPGRLVLDISGGRLPQDLTLWWARATAVGGVLRQRLGTLRLTLPLVTVPAAATCPTITSRPKAAL